MELPFYEEEYFGNITTAKPTVPVTTTKPTVPVTTAKPTVPITTAKGLSAPKRADKPIKVIIFPNNKQGTVLINTPFFKDSWNYPDLEYKTYEIDTDFSIGSSSSDSIGKIDIKYLEIKYNDLLKFDKGNGVIISISYNLSLIIAENTTIITTKATLVTPVLPTTPKPTKASKAIKLNIVPKENTNGNIIISTPFFNDSWKYPDLKNKTYQIDTNIVLGYVPPKVEGTVDIKYLEIKYNDLLKFDKGNGVIISDVSYKVTTTTKNVEKSIGNKSITEKEINNIIDTNANISEISIPTTPVPTKALKPIEVYIIPKKDSTGNIKVSINNKIVKEFNFPEFNYNDPYKITQNDILSIIYTASPDAENYTPDPTPIQYSYNKLSQLTKGNDTLYITIYHPAGNTGIYDIKTIDPIITTVPSLLPTAAPILSTVYQKQPTTPKPITSKLTTKPIKQPTGKLYIPQTVTSSLQINKNIIIFLLGILLCGAGYYFIHKKKDSSPITAFGRKLKLINV